MNTGDRAHSSELTDGQLDALLAGADQELLEHIQARADPTATLTAILNSDLRPAEITSHGPASQAEPDVPGLLPTDPPAFRRLLEDDSLPYSVRLGLVKWGRAVIARRVQEIRDAEEQRRGA